MWLIWQWQMCGALKPGIPDTGKTVCCQVINRVAARGGVVAIDEETAALLNYADTCYRQSESLFDITSGVLRQAWDFKSQKIPKKAVIKQLLSGVGWDKVQLSATQIRFKRPGMQLDFGGIGKEYAVDRAAAICREHGD